jgi:hypothetical protein
MGSWTGTRVAAYGPFDSSRSLDNFGLHFGMAFEERPWLFLRAQAILPASRDELRSYGCSFGTELRLEDPDWFWGVGVGLDARIERFEQQETMRTLWSPTPHEVRAEGFVQTTIRPIASLSVQYPGILLYIPVKIAGPVQPITRLGVEYSILKPKGNGAFIPFSDNFDPIQYTFQVGFRFR